MSEAFHLLGAFSLVAGDWPALPVNKHAGNHACKQQWCNMFTDMKNEPKTQVCAAFTDMIQLIMTHIHPIHLRAHFEMAPSTLWFLRSSSCMSAMTASWSLAWAFRLSSSM